MVNFKTVFLSKLGLVFITLSCLVIEAKEIRGPDGKLVYVDTHDSYAHAGLKKIDQNRFTYFQKPENTKAVALTIDCAWVDDDKGYDYLDALSRNDVKATFFISGPFILKSLRAGVIESNLNTPKFKMIKRIIDDGHEIANHSINHPHNATNTNWIKELKDVELAWNMIIKKLYGETIPDNAKMKNYWRAPYGEYDNRSLTQAASAGYPFHFGWNIDIKDTIGAKDCNVVGNVSGCLDAGKLTDIVLKFSKINDNALPAFVILSHLSNYYYWGKYQDGLDLLFDELRKQGYEFFSISQIFKFH